MKKIVVVDDEADICFLLKRFLSKNDFIVETAQNGKDGLALIESVSPDLVMTDFRLGDITGTELLTAIDEPCSLIVWNDEVNTFEWVIETLIKICGHSIEQAEQCAIIIDAKGKYAVKEGSYESLKPQCDAITDRGINATIEVIAN